jgi:hypothetical protein
MELAIVKNDLGTLSKTLDSISQRCSSNDALADNVLVTGHLSEEKFLTQSIFLLSILLI